MIGVTLSKIADMSRRRTPRAGHLTLDAVLPTHGSGDAGMPVRVALKRERFDI
ncbi:hypothetical protein KCP73_07530 [Salmonella enterica subsp. enterica]|nr:hypothetical protein KCP73_07530 [Salmonella enterica subsp. enterica]